MFRSQMRTGEVVDSKEDLGEEKVRGWERRKKRMKKKNKVVVLYKKNPVTLCLLSIVICYIKYGKIHSKPVFSILSLQNNSHWKI